MEQDGELQTPDTHEAQAEDTLKGKDVILKLSKEELESLDTLGPDDETVKEWLKANNIAEGDRLIAQIEGESDRVLVTDAEDFLTRDRVASDTWNEQQLAESARSIVAIEDEIDQHSAEIGLEAERPALTEEEVRKVGDEGLDSVGIEDPSEEDAEEVGSSNAVEVAETDETGKEAILGSLEHTYEQKVDAVQDELRLSLEQTRRVLDEQGEFATVGQRTIIQSVELSVSQLKGALNHLDDYPVAAVQTLIKQTITGLESVHGAAGRFSEGTITELRQAIGRNKTAMAEQKAHAHTFDNDFASVLHEQLGDVPGVSTERASLVVQNVEASLDGAEELDGDLAQLQGLVDGLRGETISRTISHLDEILRQSYSRPVDTAELYEVIRAVSADADVNGDVSVALTRVGTRVQAFAQQVDGARAQLLSRRA